MHVYIGTYPGPPVPILQNKHFYQGTRVRCPTPRGVGYHIMDA